MQQQTALLSTCCICHVSIGSRIWWTKVHAYSASFSLACVNLYSLSSVALSQGIFLYVPLCCCSTLWLQQRSGKKEKAQTTPLATYIATAPTTSFQLLHHPFSLCSFPLFLYLSGNEVSCGLLRLERMFGVWEVWVDNYYGLKRKKLVFISFWHGVALNLLLGGIKWFILFFCKSKTWGFSVL